MKTCTGSSTPGAATLSIVIVSFQVRVLLRKCLESVRSGLAELKAEIWVVDNASGDGSAEMVAREFPEVRLLANRQNTGFAAANNQVLRQLSTEFVLLLNPDTEIKPGLVQELISFLRATPRAGVVGPRLVAEDGEPQVSVRGFPKTAGTVAALTGLRSKVRRGVGTEQPRTSVRADWISGAALLVRGKALQEVGLLDEAFFMYGEDVDWCRRFWDQGWEVWHLPTVSVMHVGGQSAASFNANQDRKLWLEQSGRNEYIYFRKHHGWLAAWAIRWTSLWASLASNIKWKWVAYWRRDQAARKLSTVYTRKALAGLRGWGLARR